MISIVVPVYNIKAHVENCIQSILKQTYTDFELFLVDDGSTDGSGDICDRYAALDGRIQVIHKKNGGLSDARNTGTKLAAGEWITYIDGDDYIEREYLAELYKQASENGAQISVVQACIRRGGYAEKEKGKKPPLNQNGWLISGKEAAGEIVHRNNMNMICAWGKLYHRDLLPMLVYPCGRVHEDEFITYRVFYEAAKVAVSLKKYYNYVIRGDSITRRDYYEKRLDKLDALKEAICFFEERREEELAAYAKLRYFLNLQIAWYRVKKSSVIKEKQPLLLDLQRKRQLFWKEEKKLLLKTANPVEKTAIRVFSVSPALYSIICSMLLSVQ